MERTVEGFRVESYHLFLIIVALLIALPSCKPVEQELKVKIETGVIKDVGHNYCVYQGEVVDAGNGLIEQHGFCFSLTENPTIFDDLTQLGNRTTTGSFTDSLLNLQVSTDYYVRAYAQSGKEIVYGDQSSFTTLTPISPMVAINTVGEVKGDTVEVSSIVTDDGGSVIMSKGVCWGLEQNPTNSDSFTSDGTGVGSFSSLITGLVSDTVYYIRAYATSSVATSYSSQHQVSTPPESVSVATAAISGITMTSAVTGGNITEDGGSEITARGVCWDNSTNPDINDNITSDGTGSGSFTSSITGLVQGTTYFVRAYATNTSGTHYGDQMSFTTTSQSASLPVLSTSAASSITESSAVSGGNITDDGGSTIADRGVCWSTAHNPDLSDGFTTDGIGTGLYTSAVTGLASNTTYYVRAYATNGEGTSYGSEVSFTTPQSIFTPTVTTVPVTSITLNSAVAGGNVTDNGGSEVTARGVCWSTTADPDVTGDYTSDGTGSGTFTSSLSGLSPNTTYYARAYATNEMGTAYGSQVSFTTGQSSSLPNLTTATASSITENNAVSGGDVSDDGGSAVIARGVCWSISHNPDLNDSHSTDGTGIGSYTSSLNGLTENTTYYVRAYATNGAGTAYGNEVSFTTNASVFLPTLTTSLASSITENSAVSGGNITDDGGSAVTARGACWATSSGPDLTGDHTTDGVGSGSYISSITGLDPNTLYYIRAYATNGQGTAYGNEVSFTSNQIPTLPGVSTSPINSITVISAKGGGNITDEGGSTVIARGICWSTTQSPDLNGDQTTDGGGTGSYTSIILGLSPNTIYYVRAYATNSTGTAYGNEISFTTLDYSDEVADYDGNIYQTVVIGTQTWITENLKTTHYSNGDQIPQVTDILDWVGADEGAYCYYNNDVSNSDAYGALYNWFAVDDARNICSAGWHVPSDEEWTTLTDFVGGSDVAGAKLKEEGGVYWPSGSYGTNEYDFTARPGGHRKHDSGTFYGLAYAGYWWTSTPMFGTAGIRREITSYDYYILKANWSSQNGYSVRCIKD